MAFWDRFVLWLYTSMAESLPVGRDTLGRLLALAFQRGRLVPAALNNLSLLLILAASDDPSPLCAGAEQEMNRRRLVRRPRDLWALLQAIRRPRVADLLEIGRAQPLLRGFVGEVLLSSELVPILATFLGRLLLHDPKAQQAQAGNLLLQAAGAYWRIPQGTVDFTCRLYQRVLASVRAPDEALPSIFPPGPAPGWFAALDPNERQFLGRCLAWLPEPDLERLYLQCYARLTIEQITCVQRQLDPSWTADQVALRLEQCWQTLL